MKEARQRLALVGAASLAEVGAFVALDSAILSLAAFGSVVGLGLLHFRRRARAAHPTDLNEDPAPLDVPTMPAPADRAALPPTTPPAITDLARRLDELARELAPDPEAAARVEDVLARLAASVERAGESGRARDAKLQQAVEDARQHVAGLLAELAARQARGHHESAQRATALVDACRGIEERLAATEERLVAQAVRIETAMDDQAERAATQSHEALARICRELSAVRDDVNRASLTLAELRASPRSASAPLAEESARAIAHASESASGVARRIAQLHERVDAQAARFEDALGEGFGAARAQMEALAQSATALQSLSERLSADVARVETRLTGKLDGIREAIENLPSPSPIDLAPLHEALRETQARIDAIPAPEPLAAPLRETELRLSARIDEVAARVDALPVPEPVRAPVREAEARLAAQIKELAPVVREAESRLSSRVAGLPDEVAERVLAALPPPPALPAPPAPPAPVDLTPLRDGLARAEAAIAGLPAPEPVAAPLRETEARLRAKLQDVPSGVAAALGARFDAIPQETAERVVGLMEPFPLDAVLAGIDGAEQRMLQRIEPGLRALRQSVDTLPRGSDPAIEALAASLAQAEERLAARLAAVDERVSALPDAFPEMPEVPEVDLAPVLSAVEKLREAHRTGRRDDHARLDAAVKGLREAIAALPAAFPTPPPPAPSLDPVLAAVKESEERLARRAQTHEGALRGLRDAVAAIPTDAPSLEPVLAAVRESEERLVRRAAATEESERVARRDEWARVEGAMRALREAVAALPTEPVSLDPVLGSLKESEERLARRLAALDASRDLAALDGAMRTQVAGLARVEKLAQQAVEAASAPWPDLSGPVVAPVLARVDLQSSVTSERITQAETRLLVDVAQRHDEQLSTLAQLTQQLEKLERLSARSQEGAVAHRDAILGGIEATTIGVADALSSADARQVARIDASTDAVLGALRAARDTLDEGWSERLGKLDARLQAQLGSQAAANAAALASLEKRVQASVDSAARAVEEKVLATAKQTAEDAVAIHETVEDVLAELDARHQRLEAVVDQLGREMDARLATLEARILDELRAASTRAAPPTTNAPLANHALRPRRHLRRQNE